jgi:undecaprenyl diphosphate synthase
MKNEYVDPIIHGITKMPEHVAIIMDGNGRWAKRRGWKRLKGHKEGAKAVKRTLELSYELGLKHLTLFAFSTQNWSRPSTEVKGLMKLLGEYLRSEREELIARKIRFRAVGELSKLPQRLQSQIAKLEDQTRSFDRMTLNVALSYGGREDILQATKAIAEEVLAGKVSPDEINSELFAGRLLTSELPDPDLMIRTSGEMRISNFLLWQIAYSELHVTEVLWPEFSKEDYLDALRGYGSRERRFGLTGAQISGPRRGR